MPRGMKERAMNMSQSDKLSEDSVANKEDTKAQLNPSDSKRSFCVLACDTSNAACSCCLTKQGKPVSMAFLSAGLRHSQTFMPMVHDTMARSGVSYDEVDFFGCTVGPGSYTGIRIGVGAVQAMAFAAGKPAVPVSSLRALAFPLLGQKDCLVAAMIDARNARVFSAAYRNGIEVVSEVVRPVADFIGLCESWRTENAPGKPILVCGNAGRMYADAPGKNGADISFFSEYEEINPISVAAIAEAVFMQTEPGERETRFAPELLLPVYLSRTAAERNIEKKECPDPMSGNADPRRV